MAQSQTSILLYTSYTHTAHLSVVKLEHVVSLGLLAPGLIPRLSRTWTLQTRGEPGNFSDMSMTKSAEQRQHVTHCTLFNRLKLGVYDTVDREIFTLKIIRVKNFRVDKFSRFHSILEIFLCKCLICTVGLNRKIILTVKFSRSTVVAS